MSRSSAAAVRARAPAPAVLFAALGDVTRLNLLQRLSQGPDSISGLAAQLEIRPSLSRQAITKHLQVLAAAGFVRGQRRGREHIWELQPKRLDEAGAHLAHIARQWDQALGRLKAFVEASR